MSDAVRWMCESDYEAVATLHKKCYPAEPKPSRTWFATRPTLVMVDADNDIIGMTSLSISMAPTQELGQSNLWIAYGHGVCVEPSLRGRGLGLKLAERRHDVAREAGATFFIGQTWPGNHSMIRIFERQGLKQSGVIQRAYPFHQPPDDVGVLYTGDL